MATSRGDVCLSANCHPFLFPDCLLTRIYSGIMGEIHDSRFTIHDSKSMLLDFLTSKYKHLVDEGWGAFEAGNHSRAEEHFRAVLAVHDDRHMTVFDLADAHNGLGAIHLFHKDFFEATRWYKEAHHLLSEHYGETWPEKLSWHNPHDRPPMRTLMGLGNVCAHNPKKKKEAEKFYRQLLAADPNDELGAKGLLEKLAE